MQIIINVGGIEWIVDQGSLLNWLYANAVQKQRVTNTVKEVVNDGKHSDPRSLLHG